MRQDSLDYRYRVNEKVKKEFKRVYDKLQSDRQYLQNIATVEKSLARLRLDYVADDQDILILDNSLPKDLPNAVRIRIRKEALELSTIIVENPDENLLGELYYYWYRYPTEAVFFGIIPDEKGEHLTVNVRLPLMTHKAKILAPFIEESLRQMNTAYCKLLAGKYGNSGAELSESYSDDNNCNDTLL